LMLVGCNRRTGRDSKCKFTQVGCLKYEKNIISKEEKLMAGS
jgi:hypothetical protein